MRPSIRRLLQVPVVCVLFFVAGFLSLLLLVWMAVVSVGLMARKAVLIALDRLGGRKESGG